MSTIREAFRRENLLSYAGDDDIAGHTVRVERTDIQLIELVLAGDETAFEMIFDRHKRHVARTAGRYFQRPELVEEMIQISFAKAFVELGRFRGEHELSFPSWIGRITANACLDLLRNQRRKPENLHCELSDGEHESFLEFAAADTESSEDSVINRDLAGKLLAKLPEDDRALLHMFYVDEMSVTEIGELLGWSKSKVKIRAWRARNAVRKVMKRYL
ncbi:MAG TPA: sigma-70 family RNA polymerase sigma factor [Pyrinomonadaceae bacterium]|nr:sigma-70 family RNA polymerase sigma factor [Pyrinomonadaceae bacterium]